MLCIFSVLAGGVSFFVSQIEVKVQVQLQNNSPGAVRGSDPVLRTSSRVSVCQHCVLAFVSSRRYKLHLHNSIAFTIIPLNNALKVGQNMCALVNAAPCEAVALQQCWNAVSSQR